MPQASVIRGYNEPLMDLTNPGWRAMCVQISQNALQKGFDGLVLDNGLTSPNVIPRKLVRLR